MTPDRTRTERALAAVIHGIRNDWDEHGILTTLRKLSDKPIAQVAAAAIHCATKRHDQRTPACIALDGEHWRALDRLTGDNDAPRSIQPPERLPCPIHQHPEPCPHCSPPADPDTARQHLAAARAAIRAGRTHKGTPAT